MAHDGADRVSRVRRLTQLSDELKKLSDLVQRCGQDGSGVAGDLLSRNRDLVRRCDDLAAEMSAR